jgi:hypothetical protein
MKNFFFILLIAVLSTSAYSQKDTATQNVSTVLGKTPVDSSILIVIDGKIAGTVRELKMDIRNAIPVENIVSIDILKGFKATDKYGDKGKAGVIEFYLKNVTVKDVSGPFQKVWDQVDVEAQFPGGDVQWRNFLIRSLDASAPVYNGAPEGTYTVVAQFIVNTDGTISDIKSLTSHGYGMEQEVIRVISKGPNWEPAIVNGHPVRAIRKQPVTFSIMDASDFKLSTRLIQTGQPTQITIKELDDVKDEDIEVTVKGGTVSYTSEKTYTVTADKPGMIYFKVSRKAKKKKDKYEYGTVAIKVQ